MSSQPTAKQIALDARKVTLVRNPGTAAQRMVKVVDSEQPERMAVALAYAADRFPGQPLAWLHHADGTLEPIDNGAAPTPDPVADTRAALARILATATA